MRKMSPAFVISATALFLFVAWALISILAYSPATESVDTGATQVATVSYVIDGDTFILTNNVRVRLIGIDAPEFGDPYYKEARSKLQGLVEGRTVYLEKDRSESDRYNRLLRYAYVDGIMVNAEMVRSGLAHIIVISPDTRYVALLSYLEQEARRTRVGVWTEE